ncbi:17322_t:CDS:2, partial [Dentiscutata heterogama]
DMTTTQQGESMNHLMKGYMDATTSPYEKQAAHFLTRYALRKTQEQLIQSLNYKYETTDNFENTTILMFVQRHESKSLPQSVTYCSSSKSFECSCGYTQFSGFI